MKKFSLEKFFGILMVITISAFFAVKGAFAGEAKKDSTHEKNTHSSDSVSPHCRC